MKPLVATLFLICCWALFAGQSEAPFVPAQFRDVKAKLDLPDGDNAWVIQIVSRGGFTGLGRGDMVLRSDGKLTCSSKQVRCENKLKIESLDPLNPLIQSAGSLNWGNSAFADVCSDCFVTLLRIQRRESSGLIRTFFVY